MSEDHEFIPQVGSRVCVCGLTDSQHLAAALMADPHVQARLAGGPHRHHRGCIHNLSPDEQITARGRTRQWWQAMGLPIPVQITPEEWDA